MRIDQDGFAADNEAQVKEPRYVVQLVYAVGSPAFTSHRGITGIPGNVIEGCLQSISSVSQRVFPEEGRATIGGATIQIVDRGDTDTFTDVVRAQLVDESAGLREREVRIYVGYSDDFSEFVQVWTTYVQTPAFDQGVYTLSCADKSRVLRQEIFDVRKTRLTAPLTADATTLTVDSTDGFDLVYHGAQYSDAPSATVGYLRLKGSNEIIRYTGKTATTFTGCTRGAFGTVPKAVEFDTTAEASNFPEVQEFIYLELPGTWMALAILTGLADPVDDTKTLPDHWHLGMDPDADLRLTDFTNPGTDLYDPADVGRGFMIRFTHLAKVDGKRFLEKEVYQLLGAYSPVYQDGRLGFRRANRVISQSGWVARLDHSKVVSHTGISHDQAAVVNQVQVDWNYDGEGFTRRTIATNAASITKYGTAPVRDLAFRGLHGSRHTERTIKQLVGTTWDRYSAPPIRLSAVLVPPMNALEVGDVVFVDLPDVPDYNGDAHLSRAMEVQQVGIDWVTGQVRVDLFASPSDLQALQENAGSSAVLADGWYTGAGTSLATVSGYSAGHLTTSQSIAGHATDLSAAGAIWYHDGDLTIDAGVVLTITGNVQLRVKGFLTVNGTINGVGGGRHGGADPDTVESDSTGRTHPGSPGILGASKSGDGIRRGKRRKDFANVPGRLEVGQYATLPFFAAVVEGGELYPGVTDLRGSGGPSGGQLYDDKEEVVLALGGTGGAGGAGLLLVCRGVGFGINGLIDLSGADGALGSARTFGGPGDPDGWRGPLFGPSTYRAGSGGAGGPGGLLVYLDGDSVPYPDFRGKFLALTGEVPATGNRAVPDGARIQWAGADEPLIGVHDPATMISGVVLSDAALRIQYVPATGVPQADRPALPPAPTALTASQNVGYVDLEIDVPEGDWDLIEVYYATVNDRAFAVRMLELVAVTAQHALPNGGQGYYWARTRRRATNHVSAWYPSSATAGVFGRAQDAGLDLVVSADPTRLWNGDAAQTPIAWTPPATYADLHCQVFQFGQAISHATVRVTLHPSTGQLTWVAIRSDPNIGIAASAAPANTLQFRFTHTPSGLFADDEIAAVQSGLPGEPGAPGRPASRIVNVRRNRSTFSEATDGWLYVHGFDELGNAADLAGEISYDTGVVPISPGSIRTSRRVTEGGWLILDTALGGVFTHGGTATNLAAARKTREGWLYDNGVGWEAFTATAQMVVIGTYSRSDDAIETATLFPAAFALATIPVESANEVRPGDIKPGAISDLGAFTANLRPVEVVSSLPALPSVTHPYGSLVFLTSDRRIYRAVATDQQTWIWDKSVEGADIVAGTIRAEALAADIVLASLVRTAGAGARVELQGGHSIPFWIGSGEKGSAEAPGSGSLLWFDAVAAKLIVRGLLEASKLRGGSQDVLLVESTAGKDCEIGREQGGSFSGTNLPIGTSDASRVGAAFATYHHPGDGTPIRIPVRLASVDQWVSVQAFCELENVTGSPRTVSFKWRHVYDGGAPVYSSEVRSVVVPANGTRLVVLLRRFYPRISGWSVSIQHSLAIINTDGSAPGDVVLRTDYVYRVLNFGTRDRLGMAELE